MGRVGQPPQAGFMSPAINRPDSFTVSGPVTTNGVAVFTVKAGENITLTDARTDEPFFKIVSDNGSLQAYPGDTSSLAGSAVSGQRLMSFGSTTPNTQFGRLSYQNGAYSAQWGNVTQNDINRHDNPVGVKLNGNSVPAFVREGSVRLNNVGLAGTAFVTGTGGFANDWTNIQGNLLQVGYGLSSSGNGNQFYVDVQQETKYPLDYLQSEQRWFAFSTRRLSHEAELCMEVYRNNDPTDTAQIGWDNNGYLSISQLGLFSNGADVRVKTWYNQSGNGYHATVPDLASNVNRGPMIYPSSGAIRTIGGNSKIALDFGGSQFMRADTGGTGDVDQPLWATVVGAYDSTGNAMYFFDGDDNDRTLFFSQFGGTPTVQRWSWGAGSYPITDIQTDTNDHLFIMMYNGASSSFRIDGTTAGNSPQDVGTGDNDGLTIGERFQPQTGSKLNGKIAEIVMFRGNSSMAFTDTFVSKYETNTNNYYDIF